MMPSFYTRVVLQQLDLDTVARAYSDWALGRGAFGKVRRRRHEVGVLANWTGETVLRGASLVGRQDCRLATRRSDDEFLLHFSHRDTAEPAVFWHTVVQITQGDSGVALSHGGARAVPTGHALTPVLYPPGIVRRILAKNGPRLLPKNLGDSSLMPIKADEVSQFVDYVLADGGRELPFIIVSRKNSDGSTVVDPHTLALAMTAMARVALLPEDGDPRLLNEALSQRGFSKLHGVGDGAVRLYLPGLKASESPYDHRLWIRPRIEEEEDSERTAWIVGEAIREILRSTLPRGYFDALSRHDRRERRRMAEALVARESEQAELTLPPLSEVPALEARVEELRTSLKEALGDASSWMDEYEKIDSAKDEADRVVQEQAQKIDELQDQLKHEQNVRKHLTSSTSGAAPAAGTDIDAAVREALRAALVGDPTLEQSLMAVAALHPDSLVILETAMKSAKDAPRFVYKRKAFELLLSLASTYRDDLIAGSTDKKAGRVFGKSFAAKESESVMDNKRACALRTFRFGEKDVKMFRHLRIGVKPSITETLRIHFDWFPKEEKIVIGHCGKHLDHK